MRRYFRIWPLATLTMLFLSACVPLVTPTPTAAPESTPPPTILPTPQPLPTPEPTHTPAATPALPPPRPLGLRQEWRTAIEDTVWDVGLTDVEGDGQLEVWATSYDNHFYLITSSGGISWSFGAAAPLYTAVPADLDGDDRPEFIAGGDDNLVYALSVSGTLRWSYETRGRVTHLAWGDIEGDGQDEVVALTWNGALYILGPNGEQEHFVKLEAIPTALAVADLDGGGDMEILLGTEDGRLLALAASGRVIWEHGLEGAVCGLVLEDFDEDGHVEIVAASRNGLVALITVDGLPRWARRVGGTVVSMTGLPASRRIAIGRASGLLTLSVTDGEPLWELGTQRGVWSIAVLNETGPVLAAATDGGEILLVNLQGQVRGRIQLPSRVHGLVSGDLDRDGRAELVARCGSYLYALRPAYEGEAGESPPTVTTMPRWPQQSPLAPLPEGRISLVAVGDILLSSSIEERMEAYGTPYPFQAMAPLLQQADITVGNLLTVLSDGGSPAAKPYVFRAHPRMAAALAWAGFDVVSLANNHAMDYGSAGLEGTLASLKDVAVLPVGAGPQAREPVVVEVKGIRVAFLARNTVEFPQEEVAWAEDEQTLRQEIRQAKASADVVVLLLHAGQLYAPEPTVEQRTLARAAIEAGADLVVGHHPHRTQETERYGGGFIAYSLGNFVADIDVADVARDGAVLRVVLTKEGLAQADWIPTRIVDDVQPRPLAAPGGQYAIQPLFVETSEPLPPPPSTLPTYVLSADVDPYAGFQVQQEIGFTNNSGSELEDLVFFVYPNLYSGTFALKDVQVHWRGQTYMASYALAETHLRLFLPEPLPPGEVLTASLSFLLTLPPLDAEAWVPQSILGRSPDGRIVQLGHWYPQLVPFRRGYGWQTWDYHPVGDPFFTDLANYRVTINAPEGYAVFAGGDRRQEGNRWFLQLDAARDMGILLGRNYAQESREVGGVQVTSAFRREHGEAGQAVLEHLSRAIELFEERYGPYPYGSFLFVEGDLYGGMEYGAMAMGGAVFYEGYSGAVTDTLPALAVHELAHQWWYGVVGNNQVYAPWLDESLARYSEVFYYEAYFPEATDWWWENRVDRWNPSGWLDAAVYEYDDTATYVHNLYGVGAHFVRDLRARLGDELFFRFLQRYYRENAWRSVSGRDFWLLLEREAGRSLEDLRLAYFQQ